MGFLKGQGILEARGPFRTGQQRNAKAAREASGLGFRAQGAELGGGRAEESQPRVLAALRKGRVLRQKAVARVNSGGAAGLGRGEDGLLIEVSRRAGARQGLGVISEANPRASGVVLRVEGHAFHALAAQGFHNANSDLATVSDEHTSRGHECGLQELGELKGLGGIPKDRHALAVAALRVVVPEGVVLGAPVVP